MNLFISAVKFDILTWRSTGLTQFQSLPLVAIWRTALFGTLVLAQKRQHLDLIPYFRSFVRCSLSFVKQNTTSMLHFISLKHSFNSNFNHHVPAEAQKKLLNCYVRMLTVFPESFKCSYNTGCLNMKLLPINHISHDQPTTTTSRPSRKVDPPPDGSSKIETSRRPW